MGIIRRGSMGSVIALTVLAGIATAPAYAQPTRAVSADDPEPVNTAPPAEPEETELVDATDPAPEPEETVRPSKPGDTTNGEYCGPTQHIYTPTTKGSKYHKGVGPTNSNYNGTSRTARSTFTSEVTGEVGVSVSGELSTSVDVMVAKIEAKYAVNLSVKLTAKVGNSIAADTPPKKTTNAKYGVYRLKNTGSSYTIYSNCKTTTKKTVTSYTPMKVGWYLWES
ncbi:hypothetical protein [Streptomyces brevispora]|uniref:Uncharacterized protein n=1 Tax=Streptomyces brevispora TaxID=887462 RepID=A0ABZ1FYG8_9ACTN|nr:hypothetical protein [Streptomyces brevispora]WSC12671.1 hypothetical protein OIE64_07360 [Streptomyces brevispora]